eukprot:gene52726-46421_t
MDAERVLVHGVRWEGLAVDSASSPHSVADIGERNPVRCVAREVGARTGSGDGSAPQQGTGPQQCWEGEVAAHAGGQPAREEEREAQRQLLG